MTTLSRKPQLQPSYHPIVRAVRAAWTAMRVGSGVSLFDCIRAPDALQYPATQRTRRLIQGARAGVWD